MHRVGARGRETPSHAPYACPVTELHLPPRGDFTFRQLECFAAVAEAGSIAGAAAGLHASESAVADAVTALERSVGAQLLLRRRSRGVTLTSAGQAALPLAKELLGRASELSLTVTGGHDASLRGPVRVGALSTLAPSVLPLLIREFTDLHPDVEIRFSLADQDELAERLNDGDLDLAFAYDIDFSPEFSRVVLHRTRADLIVSADHRLADRDVVDLAEVADEPMVLLDIAPSRQHTLELMSALGVTPRIKYRTANYDLCRGLVGRGLGYSLLMARRFTPVTWDGSNVVNLRIREMPRTIGILVAWRPGPQPERVKALIDFSRDVVAPLIRFDD
ncbi:LysR family transcriptional regulator [Pseudoclavibacter endophyticus]|nr:LysR family transcriptional regulator [Pseudoclavibacter endophyticus]